MADNLVLIRHGETEWNRRGRMVGSTDIPLSHAGRQQARALRVRLPVGNCVRFVCSPRARAVETAAICLRGSGRDAQVAGDLAEVDFGEWEGLTFDEIVARDPESVARWNSDAPDFGFPGGESLAGFRERMVRVAGCLTADPSPTVCAFTHGGVIRALICRLLGLAWHSYVLFDVGPGSISSLRLFGGRGVLASLNDRAHLKEQRYG